MAFNPFEAFSIRSKLGRTVMAVLGIVVMLTFVLSTGAVGSRNDFFDQVGSIFGGKGRGDVVATAYGNDIRSGDLAELGRKRRAALTYFAGGLDATTKSKAQSLKDSLSGSRLTPETKRDIERFVALKNNSDKDMRSYENYLRSVLNPQQFTEDRQKLMDAVRRTRLKPDSDDKKALDDVIAIILHDTGMTQFLMFPFRDTDPEMLDFQILLMKADQLGIRYSKEGIRTMLEADLGGEIKKEDRIAIERKIAENSRVGDYTIDWLLEAIGNEYRVRGAMAALQGQSPLSTALRDRRDSMANSLFFGGWDGSAHPLPGELRTASALPGAMTPAEFYEFYKDRCSEHTFTLLEIPAEKFLDKVTGEPTAKERNDLFKKYRQNLPDPTKDSPGFKEPRKLKVEYVTLDAKNPRITQAIPKLEAATLFLCSSTGAMSGSVAGALTSVAQPEIAKTLPAREAVARKLDANLERYKDIEKWEFMPRDYSIYRPQPIAALLAGLAGPPSQVQAAAAISLAFRQVEEHDLRTRIPFLLQPFLTPFTPTMGNALGMPAFAYSLNPKLPPEGLYSAEVVKDLKTQQRNKLFEADFEALNTKLREATKDASPFAPNPDKAKIAKAREESKKIMTEWLKDRSLTPLGSKTALDERGVGSDPDLKPLNDKATAELDGTNSLTKQLFQSFDPRMFGRTGAPINLVHPYSPTWFPAAPVGEAFEKPNFLVWTSEDIDPRDYNTLDNANNVTKGEMTKRVDAAWRMEKARGLAKAEADTLAGKVRDIAKGISTNAIGVDRQLKDLSVEKSYRMFDISGLALLQFKHGATQATINYEAPKIEKFLVLYPTEDFATQLLELRKEPLGGVKVLHDAPRGKFYVACEIARNEKSVEQFRSVFAGASATGPGNNPLFEQYAMPEERDRAIGDVMKRLRAEAKLEEKEEFKNREKREE